MIANYINIAVRNLFRNKIYSVINIGGLAIGMTVALLIGLWIYDELTFNNYHTHFDRIAQVKVNAIYDGQVFTIDSHPIPLAGKLRSSFGEDFKYVVMSTNTQQHAIASGDHIFNQAGRFMESDAPELLSLRMVKGTQTGLKDAYSIMLSTSLAVKLFGKEDPMNRVIKIDDKSEVKITGVYDDLPDNSQFNDVSFIAPFELYISANKWIRDSQDDWSNQWAQIYTEISPNSDFNYVSDKIKNIKLDHVNEEQAGRKPVVFLHPMSKWHLHSAFQNGKLITSEQLKVLWFYGIIGIFVLLLACINFMNLSTARSEKRAKEVGIRKTIGSRRNQLINQFFSESLFVATFAFVLSLGLVQMLLPWFNEIANKEIHILWNEPFFWLASVTFTLITGLLAGAYPALYLSSFNPVKVLKGSFRSGRLAAIPRKALVVFQFTISITLIIGTIVVYQQVQFAQSRPIGYSREGLLSFQMASNDFIDKFDVIRNELIKTGIVADVAVSSSPTTSIWSTSSDFDWTGKPSDSQPDFGIISVSHDYGKTVGWRMDEGRDFSAEFATDSVGLVINKAALKIIGLRNPVGEIIKHGGQSYRILGVVTDMVMESPFSPPYPTIFSLSGDKNSLLIKISPNENGHIASSKIEKVLKKLFPSTAFDLKFVAEEYQSKFANEERISDMISFFAVLAIIISCIGLFGLASFLAEQRTKEIGIRKVLGASLFAVWHLLSKEFIILIMVSLFIATPIAFYFMSAWLQNYQYRIELSWWVFMASGVLTLLITLLTISFQALRAAIANPVMSLRSE